MYNYTNVAAQSLDESGTWIVATPMPNPRAEVTAATFNNTLYVIGDFTTDGKTSNLVEAYNVLSNTWNEKIAPLPITLHHA